MSTELQVVKTTLKPYEDRIIIDPDLPPKVTDAGLYIPESAQEKNKPHRGTVVAVGPGKLTDDQAVLFLILQEITDQGKNPRKLDPHRPIPIKPGDRVLYGGHAGTPVEDKVTKKVYLIMRFSDCFCEE